jgi:hypothetical protein
MKLTLITVLTLTLASTCAMAQPVERFKKRDGVVDLVRGNGGVKFEIQSVRGQSQCTLEGAATFVDANRAAYTSEDMADTCVALLNFTGGKLKVTTKGCDSQCGLNAGGTMDGIYSAGR